jgi:hypothetical protein
MILHTVMPPELVWSPQAEAEPQETVVDGPRQVVVARGRDGVRRVCRLISTEPRDFLDPRWQPGRVW